MLHVCLQLRAENAVVTEFDDKLRKTVQDLLHVMYTALGIGLAAPQVGINQRIMVFNENAGRGASKKTREESEKVLINPLITSHSAETRLGNEGCLSFPRVHGKVRRHTSITISYQTINGEPKQERLEGFRAVVFQHEYDHLQGVLLADRLVEADKVREKDNLDRLVAKYGPGGAI
jgi:peptide deformylase